MATVLHPRFPRAFVAATVVRSATLAGQTNQGVINPISGRFEEIVESPYLGAGSTGGSDTAYYVTAQGAAKWARVGFLNGNQAPEVVTREDEERQAMITDITHWWCYKLVNPDYAYKVTGA